MRLEWTEPAENQLDAIHDYLKRSLPGYADAIIAQITERTWQLAEFPLSGAIYARARPLEIRYVLEGSYRIFYIVGKDHVHVIGVVHTSRRLL